MSIIQELDIQGKKLQILPMKNMSRINAVFGMLDHLRVFTIKDW